MQIFQERNMPETEYDRNGNLPEFERAKNGIRQKRGKNVRCTQGIPSHQTDWWDPGPMWLEVCAGACDRCTGVRVCMTGGPAGVCVHVETEEQGWRRWRPGRRRRRSPEGSSDALTTRARAERKQRTTPRPRVPSRLPDADGGDTGNEPERRRARPGGKWRRGMISAQ